MKPETLKNVCSTAGEPGRCLVTAGMGLGWEVETVNGENFLTSFTGKCEHLKCSVWHEDW